MIILHAEHIIIIDIVVIRLAHPHVIVQVWCLSQPFHVQSVLLSGKG